MNSLPKSFSTHPQADGNSGFFSPQNISETRGKTTLQCSPKELKLGTRFKTLKKKKLLKKNPKSQKSLFKRFFKAEI